MNSSTVPRAQNMNLAPTVRITQLEFRSLSYSGFRLKYFFCPQNRIPVVKKQIEEGKCNS